MLNALRYRYARNRIKMNWRSHGGAKTSSNWKWNYVVIDGVYAILLSKSMCVIVYGNEANA